ncbi:MAG TPA: VIT domain-containing protein [Chloroflexota bacterium]|nr:VIT domain-containing protein [Chloroflexota bacterium]
MKRHLTPCVIVLHLVLLAAVLWPGAASAVRADGIVLPPAPCFDRVVPLPEPVVPAPEPSLLPIVPCWLTIRYHRVAVEITDQVATTRVDQLFVNETGRDLEGTYLFPLPEDATVTDFAMWVDDQKVEGQLLTREEARALYESIVRRNRDPALLEYAGRGAFQARVFPVPAGGERRLQLEYSQVLTQDAGLVRYVYPLNTERFSARPLQQASVSVTVRSSQPLKSVYSPSHELRVTRESDAKATAAWEQSNVRPRQNFELFYGVAQDAVGLHLLTHGPAGEDGYFLLLAAPALPRPASEPVPQDVSLVFDTSGSMSGEKIEQARRALRYVVEQLRPTDRFTIISFSSTVDRLPGGMQAASADARARAYAYIEGLRANGNTKPRLWAGRKIGHLLGEIRHRGDRPELVEEIVALATRFGIATPYTSFLVPEPGPPPGDAPSGPPLTAAARSQAAGTLRRELAAAPASGAGAVAQSEATARLREANAAPSAPTERVQTVGQKTFVLVGDVWQDVSNGQEPPQERTAIGFLSDEYFAVLEAHPELAPYLTVGSRILLQVGHQWYQIGD